MVRKQDNISDVMNFVGGHMYQLDVILVQTVTFSDWALGFLGGFIDYLVVEEEKRDMHFFFFWCNSKEGGCA